MQIVWALAFNFLAARSGFPAGIEPGTLDPTFNCGSGATNFSYQSVLHRVAEMPDGKLLVGGSFSSFSGLSRASLVRLNPDGSPDAQWPDVLSGGEVNDVLVLPSGGILIAGHLGLPGKTNLVGLAKLGSDGVLDPAFQSSIPSRDAWFVRGLQRVVALSDGSFVAGGIGSRYSRWDPIWWWVNPDARGVIHVLSDGTIDPDFKVKFGISTSADESYAAVSALAIDAQGRILVGGFFNQFEHTPSACLIRLNPDGSIDPSFAWNLHGSVSSLAIQSDGKILVAGRWAAASEWSLIRLLPDGNLDPTFQVNPSSASWCGIRTLALQSDGRILITGYFDFVNGFPARNVARLNPSGSLDSSFAASGPVGMASEPSTLTLLRDGNILVGGGLLYFDGEPRPSLVRLRGGDRTAGPPSARVYSSSQKTPPGMEVSFAAYANSSSPVRYQWARGNESIAGATNPVLTLPNVLPQHTGDYTVSVSDSFGTGTSHPVRLDVAPIDQSLGAFDPAFFTGSGPNGAVRTAARLPDGKLLIGGDFQEFDGQLRPFLARLQADGRLDPEFDLRPDGPVESIIPLSSGEFLVSGPFSTMNEVRCLGLARLTASGTWDASFKGPAGLGVLRALQSDGKFLINSLVGLRRYHSDGSLDRSFDPRQSDPVGSQVRQVAVQPDGRLLLLGDVGGVIGGRSFHGFVRLNPDGSLDESFLPEAQGPFVLRADGTILLLQNGNLILLGCTGQLAEQWPLAWTTSAQEINALLEVEPGRWLAAGKFLNYPLRRPNLMRFFFDLPPTAAPSIAVQPADQEALAGQDVSFTPGIRSTACLTFQWLFNDQPISGQTNRWLDLTDVRPAHSGYYTLEIMTGLDRLRSRPARLSVAPVDLSPGAPQLDFRLQTEATNQFVPLAEAGGNLRVVAVDNSTMDAQMRWLSLSLTNAAVQESRLIAKGSSGYLYRPAVALQPDGKTVLGGQFPLPVRGPGDTLFRLNPDGSLDPSFNPGSGPGWLDRCCGSIRAVLDLPDGRILVGGSFDSYSGQLFAGLVCLNQNGGVDSSFPSRIGLDQRLPNGSPSISALVRTPSGGAIVGGQFDTIGGQARASLARLLPDGSVDPQFNTTFKKGASIETVIAQPDGRLLVGGASFYPGDPSPISLIRLMPDGSLDLTFAPPPQWASFYAFFPLLAQRSGMIVGVTSTGLMRLYPNGTPDDTFRVQFEPSYSQVVAGLLLADDDIIVSGTFTSVNGLPRARLVRLRGGLPPSIRLTSGGFEEGAFVLYAEAPSGVPYTIERCDALPAPVWTVFNHGVGGGGSLRFNDPAPIRDQRFYRLRVD